MKNSLIIKFNIEFSDLLNELSKIQMNDDQNSNLVTLNFEHLNHVQLKKVKELCSILILKKYKDIVEKLSEREFDLIKTLCEGKTTDEIAASLNISKHTVESHLSRIYSKLDVKNSRQLMVLAFRLGLVS